MPIGTSRRQRKLPSIFRPQSFARKQRNNFPTYSNNNNSDNMNHNNYSLNDLHAAITKDYSGACSSPQIYNTCLSPQICKSINSICKMIDCGGITEEFVELDKKNMKALDECKYRSSRQNDLIFDLVRQWRTFHNEQLQQMKMKFQAEVDELKVSYKSQLKGIQDEIKQEWSKLDAVKIEVARDLVIVKQELILEQANLQITLDTRSQAQFTEQCVVCVDKNANAVFVPCGHLCCCTNCAQIITETSNKAPKCPICKAEVMIANRVFRL